MTRIAVPASWTGFRRTGAEWLKWWQGLAAAMALRSLLALLLPCSLLFQPAQAQSPSTAAPTASGQRLALVIGNAAYKQSPLLNPVNDARSISQALRESGFEVIMRENADYREMRAALREFGDRLQAGGTGLFYFAGHGMQIKGRNYLVPVDAAFDREDEIAYTTVDAQAVLDKMEAGGNATNIMILDACRTNPFPRSIRTGQQGLAPMDAPIGTLVAYATSPGAVASDGLGTNGLYTHHLLGAIRQPGQKLEEVFKQVRGNVRRDSGGMQIPWESTSLEGDFYFRNAPSMQTAAPGDARELALWSAVSDSTMPVEIQLYLNRFPNGRFATDARKRMRELAPALSPAATSVLATAPTSNQAGFFAGDRWRFQVVDKFRKEVVRNYVNTIDSVLPDGELILNGGRARWDPRGNIRLIESADSQDTYSDYLVVPPVLQSGARTPLNYSITRLTRGGGKTKDEGKGTMVVKGQEKAVTPAGTFDAWRVEIEIFGYSRDGVTEGVFGSQWGGTGGWRRVFTGWYVPELRNYVAYEEQIRTMNGIQNSSTSGYSMLERHELTSFSVRGAEKFAALK